MTSKNKKTIKSILNTTKYWGVLLQLNIVELEELVTFKGYIEDLGYEEEYGDTLICYVVFTSSSKGDLKDILNIDEEVYKWFFPVYELKYDLGALSKSLVDNSGGYMENIEFVEFDEKSQMINWALRSGAKK